MRTKTLSQGLELHLFYRTGRDNGSDIADARLDDDFTENFVRDDALHPARKLVANALFQ